MVKAIDLVRQRLVEIRGVPAIAARNAAPLIEQHLRNDATTRRGNVPSYGRMGDVPISTEVRDEAVVVKGPGWVLEKAQEKGQVEEWKGIVRIEARKSLQGGNR